MRMLALSVLLGGCVAEVDVNEDPDDDGLSNAEELEVGTDPNAADSDEDGFDDGDEIEQGTDPADAYNKPYDLCRDDITGESNAEGSIAEDFALLNQFGGTTRLYNYCDHVVWLVFAAFW